MRFFKKISAVILVITFLISIPCIVGCTRSKPITVSDEKMINTPTPVAENIIEPTQATGEVINATPTPTVTPAPTITPVPTVTPVPLATPEVVGNVDSNDSEDSGLITVSTTTKDKNTPTPKPTVTKKPASTPKPTATTKPAPTPCPKYFVDENGDKITLPKIRDKNLIKYFYQTMDIVEKYDDADHWIDVLEWDDETAVTVYFVSSKETDSQYFDMNFTFYTDGGGVNKEQPIYIEYKQPGEDNKKILKGVLKIYFPKSYKTMYSKMMKLYDNMDDSVWKYEGTADKREYFMRETTTHAVMIAIED